MPERISNQRTDDGERCQQISSEMSHRHYLNGSCRGHENSLLSLSQANKSKLKHASRTRTFTHTHMFIHYKTQEPLKVDNCRISYGILSREKVKGNENYEGKKDR